MTYDPAGKYSLPPSYLAEPGQTIRTEQHNPPFEDVAAALSRVLVRDGRAPMTDNLRMGNHRVIGVAAGIADTDAAVLSQVLRTDEAQSLTGDVQRQGRENISVGHVGRQLLINGDFTINQRRWAGGSLTANTYGYDRWKAGSSACFVTFTESPALPLVNHASGPLVQVIETSAFGSRPITVSVEGLDGGNLNVNLQGAAGVITPGMGRRGVTLTMPPDASANLILTLTPAAGPVTYRRVRANEGAGNYDWTPRLFGEEVALCQRYYEKTYNFSIAPGTAVLNGCLFAERTIAYPPPNNQFTCATAWRFAVAKRAAPTITAYSPGTGVAGKCRVMVSATDADAMISNIATTAAMLSCPAGTGIINELATFHAVADAEL